MKKRWIAIITIGIICVLVCYVGFRLDTRRGVIDYVNHKLRGDYETTVEITKKDDAAIGRLTFRLNEKIYMEQP